MSKHSSMDGWVSMSHQSEHLRRAAAGLSACWGYTPTCLLGIQRPQSSRGYGTRGIREYPELSSLCDTELRDSRTGTRWPQVCRGPRRSASPVSASPVVLCDAGLADRLGPRQTCGPIAPPRQHRCGGCCYRGVWEEGEPAAPGPSTTTTATKIMIQQ